MSHLSDHARAARIFAQAFHDQIAEASHDHAPLLASISLAYDAAADRIEEEARAGIVNHACTLDHRTIPGPKCPACGAARG